MSVSLHFFDLQGVEITGEIALDLWMAFARKVLVEVSDKKWDGRILGLGAAQASDGLTGAWCRWRRLA
jgi:hypothetical protein